MCYVNSGVLNSGKSKNELHFHFRVPKPPQGRPQGGAGGPTGGAESYTEVYILQQYSIINTLGQGKDFFPLNKKGLE